MVNGLQSPEQGQISLPHKKTKECGLAGGQMVNSRIFTPGCNSALKILYVINIRSLFDCLRGVPEFRSARGVRHSLASVLAVAAAAKLAGAQGAAAISGVNDLCCIVGRHVV